MYTYNLLTVFTLSQQLAAFIQRSNAHLSAEVTAKITTTSITEPMTSHRPSNFGRLSCNSTSQCAPYGTLASPAGSAVGVGAPAGQLTALPRRTIRRMIDGADGADGTDGRVDDYYCCCRLLLSSSRCAHCSADPCTVGRFCGFYYSPRVGQCWALS